MEISRLGISDYEECLKFLKASFNEYDRFIDFDKELPKAFRPKQELMEQNLVLRNETGILALVGIYPMDLRAGGSVIRCATVGNVATRPDERGKGYMGILLDEAIREVDRRGIQMERLGGSRTRYNRYGFEHAGSGCRYTFGKRNADVYLAKNSPKKMSFIKLCENKEYLKNAFDLYGDTEYNVDRIDEETFLCVLRAHYMEPWAVADSDGRFLGYVTASSDFKTINEMYTVPGVSPVGIAARWLECRGVNGVQIYFKSWDKENIEMSRYSEHFGLMHPSMFRIKDFASVTEPFLKLKHERTPLINGSLTVGIEGEGNFRLTVDGGTVECKETTAPADIILDRLTATRLLFGLLPPELVTEGNAELLGKLNAWLPLPLSWSMQDNV